LKRRDFFKHGAQKAAGIVLEIAGENAATRAKNWLRPPFAIGELDFLLGCTRCDKCIEACSYEVLFKLPASYGRQVAGTPAMNLLVRGCQMCTDWPCVMACKPEVLKLPEQDAELPPATARLARVKIDPKTCLPYLGPECGACESACPVPGALEWQDGLKPIVNDDLCTGCALCREACIVEPKAIDVSALIPDDGETAEAV
jgi:ferredoxin-type protein NapG